MSDLASLYIRVDSTGVVTASRDLNELEGKARKVETATQSMSSGFSKLQGIVAGLATSYALLKFQEYAKDSAMLAARVETLGVVMTQVGKNAFYSGSEMQGYADAVKRMGITTQESRLTVTQFVQSHLDLAKSAQLARVAQDAAVIGNTNSSESLRGLMHGIVTLQPEILRTYGIIVNFQAEEIKWAAANGRTVESMSGQEKQTVALNAVLKAGAGIAGSYEAAMGTVGKQITTLPRLIEEAKLQFGELFKPALTVLVKEFATLLKQAGSELEAMEKSGQLAEWSHNLATNIKSTIETATSLAKTIRDVTETVGPFVVEIGKLAALGYMAEKVAFLALNMGKLGAVIKANKEILAFLAAYEATTWLVAWADGTLKVKAETEQLTESIKKQKEVLKQAEQAAKDAAAPQLEAAQKALEQFRKDAAEIDAVNAAIQLKHDAAMKAQADKDKETLKKWQTEKETIGLVGIAKEKALLNIEYEAYKRVVEDKVALELWLAGKKQEIHLKELNEQLAIQDELYKYTGEQKYYDKIVVLINELVDTEQAANIKNNVNFDDALLLREKHFKEYVDKYKGGLNEIAAAEKELTQDFSKKEFTYPNQFAGETAATKPAESGLSTNQQFGMTWNTYVGFLTKEVVAILDKNQKEINEAPAQAEAARVKAANEASLAAKAAADAETAAQKAIEIANKNIELTIQIYELAGQSETALTFRRLQELSAMDESSQLLQRRIYYLQDEATKQKKATDDQIAANEKLMAAQKEAAAAALQAAQDLAKAQDASATAWKSSLAALVSQGQAIKDFINSLGATGASLSLSAARSAYMADLAGAKAGDATSYQRVTQSAGAYVSTAERSAGSSQDMARIIARMKGELSGLAPVVNLDANTELLKTINAHTEDTATATGNLWLSGIKAVFDLTQTLTLVDNSSGLPDHLKKMIVDQAGDYKLWLVEELKSTDSEAMKRLLIDGAGIYTATVNAIAGVIDANSQKLAIEGLGYYKATVNAVMGENTLDDDTKKLALTAGNAYLTTITQTLNSNLTPDDKAIALATGSDLLRTVKQIIDSNLSSSDKAIALAVSTDLQRTVALTAGSSTMTETDKLVALQITGSIDRSLKLIATGDMSDQDKKVALLATEGITKTINAIAGSKLIGDDLKVALSATENIKKTMDAELKTGVKDSDAYKLATALTNTITTTVNTGLVVVTDATKLALRTTNTIATYVSANLITPETATSPAYELATKAENQLTSYIQAVMSTTKISETDALKALQTGNDLQATIQAIMGAGDKVSSTTALKILEGTIDKTAKITAELTNPNWSADPTANPAYQLALAAGNDWKTKVTAAFADTNTQSLLDKLLLGSTSTVDVNGNMLWNPAAALHQLWTEIKTATEDTALHTKKMLVNSTVTSATSVVTQTFDYAKQLFGPPTTVYTNHGLNYWSDGTVTGFAKGGIASGPESGYGATLHGTELIVSPKASYPATVVGGDNSAEQTEELKRIRTSIEAGNLASVKNTNKIAKILARFDDDGLPAVRTTV